jgi:hypothetical protein
LHPFTLTTKGTRAHRLSRQALLRNLPLTIHLTHGLVNHLLAIRVHKVLRRSRVKALRGTAKLTESLLERGLRLTKPGLGRCGHGRLRGLHSGLLGAVKTGLRCCHAGLLRCINGCADTLLHPGLLRCLLRHLNGLLALANGLAKPGLLRCLLRHDGSHHGIVACALQALESATEIRWTGLSGCPHGLAKGHVLRQEARLPGSLRGHANSLLALAKALLHGLLRLAKLRLRTLKLTGRLAKQGLRAAKVCAACAKRQLLRLSQAPNALGNG